MSNQVVRNLPAEVQTEIAIDFTRPVFLVKLEFVSGTQYLSSGPQITLDGNVYSQGQVSVGTFEWNSDGAQRGTIILSNENNAAAALILGNNVNDVTIEIFQTYLIAGGGNTDPQLYVRGSMDGSNIGASRSTIKVLSTNAQTGFAPSRYFTADEGFNWLPIDGEVITWNGEVFQLRAEK